MRRLLLIGVSGIALCGLSACGSTPAPVSLATYKTAVEPFDLLLSSADYKQSQAFSQYLIDTDFHSAELRLAASRGLYSRARTALLHLPDFKAADRAHRDFRASIQLSMTENSVLEQYVRDGPSTDLNRIASLEKQAQALEKRAYKEDPGSLTVPRSPVPQPTSSI